MSTLYDVYQINLRQQVSSAAHEVQSQLIQDGSQDALFRLLRLIQNGGCRGGPQELPAFALKVLDLVCNDAATREAPNWADHDCLLY